LGTSVNRTSASFSIPAERIGIDWQHSIPPVDKLRYSVTSEVFAAERAKNRNVSLIRAFLRDLSRLCLNLSAWFWGVG
jgi:hypothetical protein